MAGNRLSSGTSLQLRSLRVIRISPSDAQVEKGSLDAIAELALLRGTGARALKSIIEEALLNSMFEIPSRPEIKRCLISERSIREALEPEFELGEEGESPARLVGESA